MLPVVFVYTKSGKKEVYMGILKKSYPYYKRIYGILALCILLGLTQGVIGLVEPQIVTLIVDNVINPALGEKPESNSSIFAFLIEDIPQENLWEMMFILVGVFSVVSASVFCNILYPLEYSTLFFYKV